MTFKFGYMSWQVRHKKAEKINWKDTALLYPFSNGGFFQLGEKNIAFLAP